LTFCKPDREVGERAFLSRSFEKNNLDCGQGESVKRAILNHSSIFEEEFDFLQAGRGGRREGFPLEALRKKQFGLRSRRVCEKGDIESLINFRRGI